MFELAFVIPQDGIVAVKEVELWKLLSVAHQELALSEVETPERRNALASFENITRALSQCRS